jgi:lysophospholipase L1-like esterase
MCADLFEITQDSETQRLSLDYTSDGLHLNESGYERMAETLFEEAIRELLMRDIPS